MPQPDTGTGRGQQPSVPNAGADEAVDEAAGVLSVRICGWSEGDDASAQRVGARFHVCGEDQRRGGAALDAVLPAGQSKRGVFGGADVEGGGDVFDGACAISGGADAADERVGGGGAAVVGGW